MFKKIPNPRLMRSALLALCVGSGAAQAAVTVSVGSPVSAGMATFTLQSTTAGTGYLTVLEGTGATCGSVVETQAGQASGGAVDAYRRGSLVLTASTNASYTVRNLAAGIGYKVCATDTAGTNVASATFTTPAMATYTSPGWKTVGSAGFPAGEARYQSLTFAPDGTPYVAYSAGVGQKNTVMHFGGIAWAAVGGAELSDERALVQSLSFAPDGTLYVAFADSSNRCNGGTTACNAKATVMRYNAAASTPAWELVGSAGFSFGLLSYLSLTFAPDGTPYVIYMSNTNPGGPTITNRTAVKRFVDGAWESVDDAALLVDTADHQSLAFAPDGTLYIAYRPNFGSGETKVLRLNTAVSPNAWVPVSNTGLSKGQYQSLSFAPDGRLYMAYMDASSFKSTVKRWDGSTWVNVGGAGFSAGRASYQSLSFAPDGTPYVAYQDDANDSKTTVMRLSGSGTSWETVGSAGFSAGGALYQSLSFAPDGTPYVAYRDDGDASKTIVKRLVNLVAPDAPTAVTAVAGNGQATVSFTAPASNGGSAITGYTVVSNPGGFTGTCAASPCTVTGLSNGTSYIFKVAATNGVGASAASDASASVTPAAPVNGACGSADSTTPLLTSAPSTGLCTAGTAGPITAYTDASISTYLWECKGSGGGADSSLCSASRGYTVTPSAGAGGSISPNTPQVVAYKATPAFTFTANTGYTVAAPVGTCGGALLGSTYTTTAITADCTVAARFTSTDTTAPSITALALSSAPTRSSAGVTVTLDENSAGYWLLVASGAAEPTAAQVKARVNYGGVVVLAKGNLTLAANTAATINMAGLATGTAYTLYLVAEDASGNQSVVARVDFSTAQVALNDTGQTHCYDAANVAALCDAATAGNAGARPRQDGRYGRDVAGMSKVGGGAAGFDFTRICWNGAAEGTTTGANTCTGTLVENTTGTASGTAATDWACTKDNVTGLVWSLQSKTASWNAASAPGYADADHNTPARCGFSADWRMPTRRELLSIVHNGLSTGPVVDAAYFPGTTADWHWSSNSYVPTPTLAAIVNFNDGATNVDLKTGATEFVRLVRSAP